jgi:hypothetical protein
MKCTESLMNSQATLSANVCYCITADQGPSLWGSSVSVDFIFQTMSGSTENMQHFFFSIKITLILTLIKINLQIYSTHPSLLTQILMEKSASLRQNCI